MEHSPESSFDPANIDYYSYSERAHRPTVKKSRKYKEAFCEDAHLFEENKRHFSSSCESHNKKSTTSTTYTTATTINDLSTIMDDRDDLDSQIEVQVGVHLRQVTPVTDVLGNETLAEGATGIFSDQNTLLLGTVSIGLILLVTVAVLYVKCVINKKEDKAAQK